MATPAPRARRRCSGSGRWNADHRRAAAGADRRAAPDAARPRRRTARERTESRVEPLVELPGQLLQNPEQELFTVRSSRRAYWRLTALGDFDGTVWSLDETTGTATDSLTNLATTTGPITEVTQTYRIGTLAAVWLPAAYQPIGFEAAATSFRASFEPVSSTLLVGSGHRDSDGLTYTVRSAVPSFEPAFLESLRNDPSNVPPGFAEVPADLSPALAELAAGVTEGREGPYKQALALQDWFRSGFEYDLDVAPGHSSSRLETFLLAERRGYCEQFAGAFATLARTLGLPARVAVGFTPGIALETGSDGVTLYSVRGEHAHAWPEVFVTGAGWVAFEPTPGRGAPGAEDYTFVPEQQDAPGPSTAPALAPPSPPVQPPNGERPAPAHPPVVAEPGLRRRQQHRRASGAAGGPVRCGRRGRRSPLRDGHGRASGHPAAAAATLGDRGLRADRDRGVGGGLWNSFDPAASGPASPRPPWRPHRERRTSSGSAPEMWRRLAFCVSVAGVRRRTHAG